MDKLVEMAIQARKNAYAPYSKFKVGAALETVDGKIFTGSNVENSSYGLAICAERVAIFKAVNDGHKKFKRIAIAAKTKRPCPPCGACRQVLFEFADDMEVIMSTEAGKTKKTTLKKLLPESFRLKTIRK